MNSFSSQTSINKSITFLICTMFNTKAEHGPIYIDPDVLYQLFNGYCLLGNRHSNLQNIYATSDTFRHLSVDEFTNKIFPFIPLEFCNRVYYHEASLFFPAIDIFLYNKDTSEDPEILNYYLNSLKITCLILSIININRQNMDKDVFHENVFKGLVDPLIFIEDQYSIFKDHIRYYSVSNSFSYYVRNNIISNHDTVQSILDKFESLSGEKYEFFRKY